MAEYVEGNLTGKLQKQSRAEKIEFEDRVEQEISTDVQQQITVGGVKAAILLPLFGWITASTQLHRRVIGGTSFSDGGAGIIPPTLLSFGGIRVVGNVGEARTLLCAGSHIPALGCAS